MSHLLRRTKYDEIHENASAKADSYIPSIPDDDIRLRRLLERFGLIEEFTPYVHGGRGAVRKDEARKWLEDRRNEAIAEFTLIFSTVAMVAAILAMMAAVIVAMRK